jgi:hypothetical protein
VSEFTGLFGPVEIANGISAVRTMASKSFSASKPVLSNSAGFIACVPDAPMISV